MQSALRKWRKALGLTQKQAADRLGVSVRTYEGWEQGKGPSNPGPVKKLMEQATNE